MFNYECKCLSEYKSTERSTFVLNRPPLSIRSPTCHTFGFVRVIYILAAAHTHVYIYIIVHHACTPGRPWADETTQKGKEKEKPWKVPKGVLGGTRCKKCAAAGGGRGGHRPGGRGRQLRRGLPRGAGAPIQPLRREHVCALGPPAHARRHRLGGRREVRGEASQPKRHVQRRGKPRPTLGIERSRPALWRGDIYCLPVGRDGA